MGEVYRADDLALGQPAALKFLPESLTENPESVARFRNEVKVARKVSHPNVCRVYDVGEFEGHLFLSMEYVDGEDLASLLRRIGRLPGDKAIEIARRLCAGLAAAHEKGVLHRDLKPSNIMLDGRGQVLLTDFGLAGLAGEIAGAEVRSGTPAYMAPEQLAGKEVTLRSDIYSLGLVLYELFTGKRPFEAKTLEELVRARSETTPVSLSALVRDLDPMVERVVLRCLDPEPSRRPSSALVVAAALPGGDPLAAALAAGETPTPEMVAAAGEGAGLSTVVATAVLVCVIAGVIASAAMAVRTSGLERIHPRYSPDVLAEKAREAIERAGYSSDAADDAYGFDWDGGYVDYVKRTAKPAPRWSEVLSRAPSPLRFWYRQSPYPLVEDQFHNELLTPGDVQADSPPPILSGMINVQLDSRGQLTSFQAIPPERQEPARGQAVPVDWTPLFGAAGLDIARFQPVEPLWTSLAASDTRLAWTGVWPGTPLPLRVEAASLRGKPVAFSLIGPWTKPSRMPGQSGGHDNFYLMVAVLAVVVLFGAAVLARRNMFAGRGDRRGASRLAAWMFCVLMAIWLSKEHLVPLLSMFGMFFLALCTATFYGVVVWTVYVALEPLVRRYWPRTLISWSTALTGRVKDPVVGRDVLFGAAMGVLLLVLAQARDIWDMQHPGWTPNFYYPDVLLGVRGVLGAWFSPLARQVFDSLLFFFLLFLLRVLLRNQWAAAGAWVLVFTWLDVLGGGNHPLVWAMAILLYGLQAMFVLRFGLLAFAVAYCVEYVLLISPVTPNSSAWYFGNGIFMLATIIALSVWGFYCSVGGRRLWNID